MHQAGKKGVGASADTDTGEYKSKTALAASDYAKEVAWREARDEKLYESDRFKKFSKLNNMTYDDKGYIQDQVQLGDIPYGTKGTGAGNACGPIMVKNVYESIDKPTEFKDIYNALSENATLMGGKLGTNPMEVKKILEAPKEVDNVKMYLNPKELPEHDRYGLLYVGADIDFEKGKFEPEGHYHYMEANEDGTITVYNEGKETKDSLEDYREELFPNENPI
jgi:hypothetical protein